jgi:hypothetical protein
VTVADLDINLRWGTNVFMMGVVNLTNSHALNNMVNNKYNVVSSYMHVGEQYNNNE